MMGVFGPEGFWIYLGVLMLAVMAYAAYRMTRRPSAYAEEDDYDATSYALLSPTSTPVALEVAQEIFIEASEEEETSDP
jgi:hypothetical protein